MALHKKPTKAELKLEAEKALQEFETPVVEEPQEEVEETPEEPQEEINVTLTNEPEEQIEEEPEQEIEPLKSEPDYKKRYADSTREAQILHEKNKSLVTAIEQAASLDEPTEEELQKEYSDWELMTETERRLAKESLISTRRFKIIHEENQKFKKVEDWSNKVDEYIDNPATLVKNPELEGKTEEFKLFASKSSRVGIDFDVLVSAFLFDVEKSKKSQQTVKRQMFETGTGGVEKNNNKKDVLTIDEGRLLMKTDYGKFKELLKAGKIELPN